MAGISVDGIENFGTALWITFFTIMGTLIGTAFTIYKHFTTQRDNKRLGLIKQIEHYEKALYEIVNRYHNSKHELNDCKICADHTLVVLDKISYLRKKNY